MIVPWLRGFSSFSQAPLAWTLVATNIFFYFLTLDPSAVERNLKGEFLKETGFFYQQYLSQKLKASDTQTTQMSKFEKSPQELIMQGGLALKDPQFIATAQSLSLFGDQLAIKEWKIKIQELQALRHQRPVEKFGFRDQENSRLSWLTYQFMHANFYHLLGNLFLLLLVAGVLEQKVGSLLLIFIYLSTGLGGALFYKWFGHSGLIPMVGASGSISGLIAFYSLLESKKRVSFFYFLSPVQGYYGWIYLPTLLILPFSFLPDLASFLVQDPRLGSTLAHSAHLGGALFGALLALAFKFLRGEQNLVVPYFLSHTEDP